MMIDIALLESNIELLAEKVHNAWWLEKIKQDFHPPIICPKGDGGELPSCDFCHTDMIPYADLAENIKDYDRVTVRTVLASIKELSQ